jgi:hypothetical protein
LAVVFIAHNGIGIGHLARTFALCESFWNLGETSVIFAQGASPRIDDDRFPIAQIPRLYDVTSAERATIAQEISTYALRSRPAIVFEDTHPTQLSLALGIRRILVVRPTDFGYLRWLNQHFKTVYDAFLLADAPGSPTWVYNLEQTSRIGRWQNWFKLGPVYRVPTDTQCEIVGDRYAIRPGDPVCVMSMGGGGLHSPADPDISTFLSAAGDIGREIRHVDPTSRLVFVKGPLFPRDVRLSEEFEVIEDESYMPALLAVARAAVIRPGFNTTWECLSAGTPFTPVLGTSYREPIEGRVLTLASRGYVNWELAVTWNDTDLLSRKRERAQLIKDEWPGQADPTILLHQLGRASASSGASAHSAPPERSTIAHSRFSDAGVHLAIRVDDVVNLDDNLRWLIELLTDRDLHASLEVIPYLCRFNEADLNAVDPLGHIAVGQHGFAHLKRITGAGGSGEFGVGPFPTREEATDIEHGRELIQRRFPTRFSGGFSPPYDRTPDWLAPLWKELGGSFLSCIWARPRTPQLRIARATVETWDWHYHAPVAIESIMASVERLATRSGRVGLVVHPWLLSDPAERARITEVIDSIILRGAEGVPLVQLAGAAHGTGSRTQR